MQLNPGPRGLAASVRVLFAAGVSAFGLLGIVALRTSPAFAVDGVLEINQTCAIQTGCFVRDTAGFPVTITTGGSYRLTSNLEVPNEYTDGIVISADDVAIDLNNFAIQGPATCSGTPAVCLPTSGTGMGVKVTVSTIRGASVRNGAVSGMGSNGISLGDQSEVTHVRVRWNRGIGIAVATGSAVAHNIIHQNGQNGASAGSTVVYSANSVYANGLIGLSASSGGVITGNTVTFNGTIGISTGTGSTISGNSVRDSLTTGISTSGGATISGNSVYSNDGVGINAGSGSVVEGNAVALNSGFGLSLSPSAGYRGNVMQTNIAGSVSGGLNLGDNACNGAPICP